MKIATRNEIRNIDNTSINKYGIPGIVLMENAARTTAEIIEREYQHIKRISIFCGTGNNGGDGFAIARHLINNFSKEVSVYICGDAKKIRDDSQTNFTALKNLNCNIKALKQNFSNYDKSELIIDALFGTGLDREISGFYKKIIQFMNKSESPVVSVDIPSGLDSDTGRPLGVCVQAETTVTYALPKLGMCIHPGVEYCGKIFLSGITTPNVLEDGLKTELITASDLKNLLKQRSSNSHKGTYGHLLIIAGSPGKTGAATLAAMGSQRIGTGLTTVAVPQSLNTIIEQKLTEAMSYPVSGTEDGTFGKSSISQILDLISDRKSAIAIGPGISLSEETELFLNEILNRIKIPVILDADAISLISRNPGILKIIKPSVILTPHPGEMSRITGLSTREIQENRINISREFASEYNVYIVLKGSRTVIATPDKRVYINSTGNPGMATGGMGDVLSGIIGGLLAQGYDAAEACRIGVYIHGLAGDLASDTISGYGYLASEIADFIPESINVINRGEVKDPIIREY